MKAPRAPHLRKLHGAALIEFNLKHPRDRKGRFIETGGIARMWGGLLVRVLGMAQGANGRPMVRVEDRKGRRRMYEPSKLTMIARPDGSRPTASKAKVQKADADRDADPNRPNTDQIDVDDRGKGLDLDDERVRRWSRAEQQMLDEDDDDDADRRERFDAEDSDTPDFVASREDPRDGDLLLLRDEQDDRYEFAQVQSVTKDGRPGRIVRFSQNKEEDYDPDRYDAALIPAEDVDKAELIADEFRGGGGLNNPQRYTSETAAAKQLDNFRVNRDTDRKRTVRDRDEARARRDAKREKNREAARQAAADREQAKREQSAKDALAAEGVSEQQIVPESDGRGRVDPDNWAQARTGGDKLGLVLIARQTDGDDNERRRAQETWARWQHHRNRSSSGETLDWLYAADEDEVQAFVARVQSGMDDESVQATADRIADMGREIRETPDGERWHPNRPRRADRNVPDVDATVAGEEGGRRDRDPAAGDAAADRGPALEDVAAAPVRADDLDRTPGAVQRPGRPGRGDGEASPDRRGVDTGGRGDTGRQDAPGADGGVDREEQRDPRPDPARPGAGDSGARRADVDDDGDGPEPEMAGTLQRFPDAPRFNPRSQDDLAPNSTKERARANIEAIRTLRQVQDEGRPATPEEQSVLARWSGWGALSEPIFGDNPRNVREFADERAEIAQLLDADELALARRNALNAHYTDIGLVDEVWDFMADAGVTEGNVLEPGSGSGNFMARRPDGVQMVGVEFDPITAGISQLLYPDSVVINERIQDVDLPDQGFDAVVGNVPFQRARMYDPVYSPQRQHNLHNLSIIKSLDKTRPGGLAAVVTSAGTMDSKRGRDSRRAMHDKADLVAAIRLPGGAHRRAAGTDVVTDLLIFRRRGKDEKPGDDKWVDDVREIGRTQMDGRPVHANGYFVDNPQQVLGRMTIDGGLNAREQMVVKPDQDNPFTQGDVPAQLRGALNRAKLQMVEKNLLPTPRDGSAPDIDLNELTSEKIDKPEAYIGVDPGDLFYEVRGGRKVPVNVPRSHRVRARKLIEMGDVADRLLAEQAAHEDETPEAIRLRKQLNKLHDSYMKRYGAVTKGKLVGSSPKDDYYGKADDDERTPIRGVAPAELAEWQIIEIPGRWDDKGNRARAIVKEVDTERGVTKVQVVGARLKADRDVELPHAGRDVDVVGERTPTFRVELEAPKIVQGSALAGLIFALDSYDMETGESGKSTLLTGRTLQANRIDYANDPVEVPRRLAGPDGSFTLSDAARLMGVSEQDARERLRGHAFVDHTNPDRMVERTRYLGGHVRKRHRAVQRAAVKNPELRENLAALEEVLPEEKPAHKIKVRPGATWIPADVVQDFLAELLEDDEVHVDRLYGSTWTIKPGGEGKTKRVIATQTYGHGGHWNAYNIMDSLLHNRPIRVTRTEVLPDGSKKTVFDQEATDAVQAKADQLREKFADWLFNKDPARAEQLFRDYNDTFNGLVPTQYSTDPYHPPGMVQMLGENEFALRGHQAAMVRRALAEPGSLAAHEVGAGKTFTAATIAMELRRLGMAKKPGIVVPKHLKEQWHREFLSIFPTAKVLAVSSEDLDGPDARRRFMGKVAAGDWDAVIFTFDSYKSIPMSKQGMREFIDHKLQAKRAAVDAARSAAVRNGDDPGENKKVKELEGQLLDYEEKLNQHLKGARDDGIEWERLGIDYLIVDEAHKYKNLERLSRTDEALAGGPYTIDMDMKMRHVRETSTTDRHATFLTATPVSNSIGEMYTMLQYLRPDLLEEQGIVDFDSFLVNYADQKTRMEMRPAGDGYAPKARFRDWFNLPGLQRTWLQVADVQTGDDLDLDVPDIDGGSPEMVVAKAPSNLPDYMQHLADRAESAGGGPGEDNILVINGDGSAAALDPRMVGLDAPEEGTGKLAAATEQIADIYEQTKHNRYTDKATGSEHPNEGALQLVFLDIGTPGAKGDVDNPERVSEQVPFNAYEEIRQQLAAKGVPADKVAFIHEAKNDRQRAAMFKKARSGEIAVLIGSTPMMGTGVNVQDRAVALHHLDAPYRPSDIQQRDGRAVRQGNQNGRVRVLRYTTAGSLDARKWQIQESKARMVESLMRGDLDMDEAEMGDLGGQATVNAQELAAITADDPVLLAKLDVDLKVNELQTKRRTLENAQSMASGTVQRKVDAANRAEENVARINEIRDKVKKRGGDEPITGFEITVEGVDGDTLKKRADINDAFREVAVEKVWNASGIGDGDGETTPMGTVGGFQVVGQTKYNWMEGKRSLHVWMPDVPDSELEPLTHSMIERTDFVGRLERKLDDLDDRRDMYEASVPQLRKEADQARALIGQGFEQQAELDALRQRQRRLDELMGWMAANKDATPDAIPEHLRSDPVEVIDQIGAIDTDRKEVAERPAPGSLSNLLPDGTVKPRENAHLRRKVAGAKKPTRKAGQKAPAKDSDKPTKKRNPNFGKPAGDPVLLREGPSQTRINQPIHGRNDGQVVDKTVWVVQRDGDGVWGAYPPTHQVPDRTFGDRREAEDWAMDRAKGVPDPDAPEPDEPTLLDQDQVADTIEDLGGDRPEPRTPDPDTPDTPDVTPDVAPDTTPDVPEQPTLDPDNPAAYLDASAQEAVDADPDVAEADTDGGFTTPEGVEFAPTFGVPEDRDTPDVVPEPRPDTGPELVAEPVVRETPTVPPATETPDSPNAPATPAADEPWRDPQARYGPRGLGQQAERRDWETLRDMVGRGSDSVQARALRDRPDLASDTDSGLFRFPGAWNDVVKPENADLANMPYDERARRLGALARVTDDMADDARDDDLREHLQDMAAQVMLMQSKADNAARWEDARRRGQALNPNTPAPRSTPEPQQQDAPDAPDPDTAPDSAGEDEDEAEIVDARGLEGQMEGQQALGGGATPELSMILDDEPEQREPDREVEGQTDIFGQVADAEPDGSPEPDAPETNLLMDADGRILDPDDDPDARADFLARFKTLWRVPNKRGSRADVTRGGVSGPAADENYNLAHAVSAVANTGKPHAVVAGQYGYKVFSHPRPYRQRDSLWVDGEGRVWRVGGFDVETDGQVPDEQVPHADVVNQVRPYVKGRSQPDEVDVPEPDALPDGSVGRDGQDDVVPESDRTPAPDVAPNLTVRDYEGTPGNRDHITRREDGTVPTSAIADLPGVKGEVPGEHRNRQGDEWEAFKADIAENGIQSPIFVTVDPDGSGPKISEGNHRRDAAVELGLAEVPVEVRYYGHAERDTPLVPGGDADTTPDGDAGTPDRDAPEPDVTPDEAPYPTNRFGDREIQAGDWVRVEETVGWATDNPRTRVVEGYAEVDDEGTLRVDGVPVSREDDGKYPRGVLILSIGDGPEQDREGRAPEPDVTPDEAPEPATGGGGDQPPRTPPAGPVPGDAEDQPAPDPDLPEQAEQPDTSNEPLIGQAGTALSDEQLDEGARILTDSDAAVKAHSDDIGPREIPQINTGGGRSKTPLKITPDDTLTGGIKVEKARGLADNEFSEVNENLRRNGFWWDKGRRAWVHRSNFPRYRDGRSVNYADTDAGEVRRWAVDSGMVDEADAKPKMRVDPMFEKYAPTEQQAWVGRGFFAGARRIVASAMAGTGKTTTLVALARRIKLAQPDRRGIHLAFNKSVAEDVVQKMPDNVAAVTGDALAWNAVAGKGKPMASKWRRRDIRPGEQGALLKNYDDIGRRLGLRDLTTDGRRPGPGDNPDDLWTAGEQARTVQQIVEKFTISADDEIGRQHLPDGMTGDLADLMLEKANAYWDDLNDPNGDFFLTNSHITKMWALTRPDLTKRGSIGGLVPRTLGINSLGKDGFIFFDEAQDINPVMARVIADQDVQVIYVGDPNQAIYGFRGASDEMSKVDADHTAQIDVTHRFGQAMTDPGNRFMQLSGSPNRVVGAGDGGEVMEPDSMPVETADAVLSRSNAGAIAEILEGQEAGRLVGVPKGVKNDLRNLVLTARWMRDPGKYRQPNIIHEDLSPFRNWREFEKAVEKTGDPKLSMLHRIVSDYDDTALLDMVEQLVDLSDDSDTRKPDLTVSTAHKSKGLEWGRVKIAGDFRAPEVNDDGSITWPEDEELRLAYVALTRGMDAIDPGSLAWVYGYSDENGGRPGSKPSKVSDVEWQRLMDRPGRDKFRRMAVPDAPEASTIRDEPDVPVIDEASTDEQVADALDEVDTADPPPQDVLDAPVDGVDEPDPPVLDESDPAGFLDALTELAEADDPDLVDTDTGPDVTVTESWKRGDGTPELRVEPYRATDMRGYEVEVDQWELDGVPTAYGFRVKSDGTTAARRQEVVVPVPDSVRAELERLRDEPDTPDAPDAPDAVDETPENIPADIPAAPEADATPPAPEPELVATPVRRTPRANNDRVVDVTRDGDVYGTVEAVMDPDRPKKVDHHRVLRGDTEVGTLHKAGKSRHRAQRADGTWVGDDGSEDGAKRFESRNAAALALLEDAGHTTPESRGDVELPGDEPDRAPDETDGTVDETPGEGPETVPTPDGTDGTPTFAEAEGLTVADVTWSDEDGDRMVGQWGTWVASVTRGKIGPNKKATVVMSTTDGSDVITWKEPQEIIPRGSTRDEVVTSLKSFMHGLIQSNAKAAVARASIAARGDRDDRDDVDVDVPDTEPLDGDGDLPDDDEIMDALSPGFEWPLDDNGDRLGFDAIDAMIPDDEAGQKVRAALNGEYGDYGTQAAILAAGEVWDGAPGEAWLAAMQDVGGPSLPPELRDDDGDVTPDVTPDTPDVVSPGDSTDTPSEAVTGLDEYGQQVTVNGEVVDTRPVFVTLPDGTKARWAAIRVRQPDGSVVQVLRDRDESLLPEVPDADDPFDDVPTEGVRLGSRVTGPDGRRGRVTQLAGGRAAVRWDDGSTSNEAADSLEEDTGAPSGGGITVGRAKPGDSISIGGIGGTVVDTDGDGELVVDDANGVPHRVDADPDTEALPDPDGGVEIDAPGEPVDTPPPPPVRTGTVNFGQVALGDEVQIGAVRGTVTNVQAQRVNGGLGADLTIITADGTVETRQVDMDTPINRVRAATDTSLIDALDRGARTQQVNEQAAETAQEIVEQVDEPESLDDLAEKIERSVENRYPDVDPGEQGELGLDLPATVTVDGKPVQLGQGDPLAGLRGLTPEQVRERLTYRRDRAGEGIRPDGTVAGWRRMQQNLERGVAQRLAASARNARPFPGESKQQAAERVQRILADPRVVEAVGQGLIDDVEPPRWARPKQTARWWRRMLPADRDKTGTRRVRDTDGTVRDRVDINPDGRPGETGAAHLEALEGVGGTLADEIDRGVAAALTGRWGENPEGLLDELHRREADFGAAWRRSGDDVYLQQWELARDELDQARRDVSEARTAAIGRALEVMRVMGGGNLRLDGPDDRLVQIRQAERTLPADWTLDHGRWLTDVSELLGRTERVRSKRWRLAKRLHMGAQSGDARSAMIALADDVERQNKPIRAAMRLFNARRVEQNKDVLSLGTLMDMLYTANPAMTQADYQFALGLLAEL